MNYNNINTFYLTHKLQLLIVNKKVSFNGKTSMFNCSYFCNDLLQNDITFVELPHDNSHKNFEASRMYEEE